MIFNVSNASGKTKIETVPSVASSLTYNGSEQSPTWLAYDPEQLTMTGVTSAVDAGTYQVAFTPTKKYKWADGSSEAKFVEWTIAKAAGSISLSETSGTISGKNNTSTGAINTVSFTVNRNGDGAISVKSSNTGIATAKVSGNVVTVSAAGYGTATITVSVAASANYTAPSDKTYSITVDYRYSTIVPNIGATWINSSTSVSKTTSSTILTHATRTDTDGIRGTSSSYTNIDTTGYNTLHIVCSHSVNNTSGSAQNWFLQLETSTGAVVSILCSRTNIKAHTNHGNNSYEKLIDISALSGIYRIHSFAESWSDISVDHVVTITTCRMY